MIPRHESSDETLQDCSQAGPPITQAVPGTQADQPASVVLADLAYACPAAGITLHDLLAQLGERGLLMFCMVLTVPFLVPLSIPGSSIPFGILIALNGVGLIAHRTPWLPGCLMHRHLPRAQIVALSAKGVQLFGRLERIIHPRLLPLTHGATMGRVNGILLVLSGLLLTAPLPLPFSNALPAYAALLLAAGTLERDGYFVVAGYVMMLLTIAYFSLVAVLGGIGMQTLMTQL
jgi:hypothetical protein